MANRFKQIHVASHHIEGVILAGGRGRRMGGQDKGLMLLQGQPLVCHVSARLQPQIRRLWLVANRSRQEYEQLGFQVGEDRIPGYPGPLAGLQAGFQLAHREWLVFCPCDTPFIPPDLVARLWQAAVRQQSYAAVAHDGEQSHYLCCLLHRSLQADLEAALADGVRSMQQWLQRHACAQADFSDCPEAFVNLNTLAELSQWSGEGIT